MKVSFIYFEVTIPLIFSSSHAAPICSWRGVRDPTVASALATAKKYAAIVDESDKPLKRDEFAGMGGMKRIR